MQDGEYTRTIYSAIKDKHFSRAIELLEPIAEVQDEPVCNSSHLSS